jgi:hypothetical protein
LEPRGTAVTRIWSPASSPRTASDGLTPNTPDAIDFIRRAEQEGVRAAIIARDGPFRDYSQADAVERPNPWR